MALTCRKCPVPLVEGDAAVAFDIERRISVEGETVRIVDVVEYEHEECPLVLFEEV